MDNRKRTVMLTVRSGSYDRNKDFFMIARDAQTKVDVLRLPLRVDLAFANNFTDGMSMLATERTESQK